MKTAEAFLKDRGITQLTCYTNHGSYHLKDLCTQFEEYATLYASEKLKEIEGKWVSVDERLPNHEGLVLISNIHDKWLVSGWLELNSSAWYNQFENEYDDIPVYPTHWMEFPPLPSSPPL